ncbi:class IIb bacteriocin, lactobin A/cerein 7B family [Leptobacterium sp. I13]|uniref:class IIb bacteriocin, lactobin A/cerein 7B family n=1 Tax=Leptobacterium meishanense TaxID=3128904 RepID=UPI0030EEFBF0
MKSMDILGVRELSTQELKNISGGWWVGPLVRLLKWVGGLLVADAAINPSSHVQAWKDGWAAGSQ